MSYDAVVKRALINEQGLASAMYKTDELNSKIFNQNLLFQQLKKGVTAEQLEDEKFDYLLIHDKIILSQYANQLFYYSNLSKIVVVNMEEVKSEAEVLLSFLKKSITLNEKPIVNAENGFYTIRKIHCGTALKK